MHIFPMESPLKKYLPHRVNEFLNEGAFSFESDTSSKVLDVVDGSMKNGYCGPAIHIKCMRSQKRYLSKITGLQTEYEIKCIGFRKVFSLTDGELVQLTSSGADFSGGVAHCLAARLPRKI